MNRKRKLKIDSKLWGNFTPKNVALQIYATIYGYKLQMLFVITE